MSTFNPLKDALKTGSRRLRAPLNRIKSMRRLREFHSQPRDLDDTVYWAMNFGGSGYYRVKTLQIPSEIHALARAVEEIGPRVALEIGTAAGGTLFIWSQLVAQRVISCDLQDMQAQQGLYQRFPPSGSRCKVTLLSGDSHAPTFRQRVEQTLAGEDVDFLFIDGDHSEQGVTADFVNYRHLVRPGGIIAFHDIVENQPLRNNQVFRLWKDIRGQYDTREFVADHAQCGFGIGVVKVAERFARAD